jgi:tRNA(Ile)-lysidine synthase TilS/MesJ
MRKFPLTIIRPLCFIHECDLIEWAKLRGYKKQKKNCPYENDSHRADIRKLFNQLEQTNPEIRYSLWHALVEENKLIERIDS